MYLLTALSAFFSILFNGNKKKIWRQLDAEENLRVKRERDAKEGERGAGENTGKPEQPANRFPDSVYTLVLFQREGRLIDFLMEDISQYSDEQVGAAARQIHSGCRKVVEENFSIKPILSGPEGEQMTLEEGFKPDEFELTGSVTGKAPFTGVLRHKGWKCSHIDLPERHGGKNPDIVCPAELEI